MFGKLRPVSQKLKEALQAHVEYNRKAADEIRVHSESQAKVGSLMSGGDASGGRNCRVCSHCARNRRCAAGMQETVSRIGRDRDLLPGFLSPHAMSWATWRQRSIACSNSFKMI